MCETLSKPNKTGFSAQIPGSGCSFQPLPFGPLRTHAQDTSWSVPEDCDEEIPEGKSCWVPLVCFTVSVEASSLWSYSEISLLDTCSWFGDFQHFPRIWEFAVATWKHFFTLSVAIVCQVFFFMVIKAWPSIKHTSFLSQADFSDRDEEIFSKTEAWRQCTHLKWDQWMATLQLSEERALLKVYLSISHLSSLTKENEGVTGFHLAVDFLWGCAASEFKSLLICIGVKCVSWINSMNTAFIPKLSWLHSCLTQIENME